MRFLAQIFGQEAKLFNVSIRRYLMVWPFLGLFLLAALPVQAYTIVEKSKVQLLPGEVKRIFVSINNQTGQVWTGGNGKIALYLYGSSSVLRDSSWKTADLPANIDQKTVLPGQVATVSFNVKAPAKVGTYMERFLLGDGKTWQKDTVIEISFVVQGAAASVAPTATTQPSAGTPVNTSNNAAASGASDSEAYAAKLLLKPSGPFSISGNGTLSVNFGIKNIGSESWKKQTIVLKEVIPNLGVRLASVRHDSWVSGTNVVDVSNPVAPGTLGLYGFKIKAPAKSGTYTVRFAVRADDQEVDGGEIDIPVTVTADGYIAPEPTTQTTTQTTNSQPSVVTNADPANLPSEPIIRVGLYATTDDASVLRGIITGMNLTQNGNTICTVGVGQEIRIVFDRANKVYKATGSGCTTQSGNFYVAVATDGVSPLEVTDFSRPVSWLPGANDNKFRGKLELRYAPKTDTVWLINELPVETYLKGIAETSDVSPMEFQKTLLTAARTYAMYHVQRATKHADEYYIVDAKYDQVYRGYGQEARSPHIVEAVDATRGSVVQYQGKIAITPYFSRSDGRTRDWSEVWGGEVAWCKGVSVPQDIGKTLWGHGVGLSASGALQMAAHEGKTYDQILKYFYTGIELVRIYR
ncbi:MAG: SpoIID/LytB domain-containing protein [Patescibacteria group bacterium]|nr:SpoIID/LytB domain-containing protein [Patescibacteria group bacterium]